MACSLVFSSLAATSFDGNTKEWRLFADVINDVGLTLGKEPGRIAVIVDRASSLLTPFPPIHTFGTQTC